jgi:hypothetical protein
VKGSTKFQINLSTNGWEKGTQSDMGTDAPTDGPTDRPTDEVSYKGALWRLKNDGQQSLGTFCVIFYELVRPLFMPWRNLSVRVASPWSAIGQACVATPRAAAGTKLTKYAPCEWHGKLQTILNATLVSSLLIKRYHTSALWATQNYYWKNNWYNLTVLISLPSPQCPVGGYRL